MKMFEKEKGSLPKGASVREVISSPDESKKTKTVNLKTIFDMIVKIESYFEVIPVKGFDPKIELLKKALKKILLEREFEYVYTSGDQEKIKIRQLSDEEALEIISNSLRKK